MGANMRHQVGPPSRSWLLFVDQLRQIRINKGISTRFVCDRVGINLKTFSNWERGFRAPHPHDLVAWLDALGLRLATIPKMFEEEEEL
jgi:transcriptional regulator with XRE-family HTH domain